MVWWLWLAGGWHKKSRVNQYHAGETRAARAQRGKVGHVVDPLWVLNSGGRVGFPAFTSIKHPREETNSGEENAFARCLLNEPWTDSMGADLRGALFGCRGGGGGGCGRRVLRGAPWTNAGVIDASGVAGADAIGVGGGIAPSRSDSAVTLRVTCLLEAGKLHEPRCERQRATRCNTHKQRGTVRSAPPKPRGCPGGQPRQSRAPVDAKPIHNCAVVFRKTPRGAKHNSVVRQMRLLATDKWRQLCDRLRNLPANGHVDEVHKDAKASGCLTFGTVVARTARTSCCPRNINRQAAMLLDTWHECTASLDQVGRLPKMHKTKPAASGGYFPAASLNWSGLLRRKPNTTALAEPAAL